MIAIVLGTRPEIIKLSPLLQTLQRNKTEYFVVHSNQHYSPEMDADIFADLELSSPDYNLGVNRMTNQGEMVAHMILKLEPLFQEKKPHVVVVQGDTNTVLAASLTAAKLGIPIAHVEAGLRSFDRRMPEEVNRIVTDHVSQFLFCPTETQKALLIHEGIPSESIFVVGNTVVDAVYENKARALSLENPFTTEPYMLLTLHRPSNVDDVSRLDFLLTRLAEEAHRYSLHILFPIHPRTKSILEKSKIVLDPVIQLIEPQGYLMMLMLQARARVVATDSGGIQEEACILGTPCLTLRESTERPETIEVGANILLGEDTQTLSDKVQQTLKLAPGWHQPFGDGKASEKIATIIEDFVKGN